MLGKKEREIPNPSDTPTLVHQSVIDRINQRALEVNGDAIAYVTSVFANTTRSIDDEIAAAAETAPAMQAFRTVASKQQYDITHWGKYWIK